MADSKEVLCWCPEPWLARSTWTHSWLATSGDFPHSGNTRGITLLWLVVTASSPSGETYSGFTGILKVIPGLIALASAPSTRHARQEVQRHRLAGGQHRSTTAKRTDARETGPHLGAESRWGGTAWISQLWSVSAAVWKAGDSSYGLPCVLRVVAVLFLSTASNSISEQQAFDEWVLLPGL